MHNYSTVHCNLLVVSPRLIGEIKGPEKKSVIYKHAVVKLDSTLTFNL